MLRFLIIALCGYLLYKLFLGDKKQKNIHKDKETEKMAASGEMVRDPICGTYVSRDGDIRVRQGGAVHHFCSYECRDAFVKRLEAGETFGEGDE